MKTRHAKQIRRGIQSNRRSRLILEPMPKLTMRAFLHEDAGRWNRYRKELIRIREQAAGEELRSTIDITVHLTEDDYRINPTVGDPGA